MDRKKLSYDELIVKIEFLTDIIEYMPTGVMVISKDGRVVMMNRYQEEISKIKRDQVIGERFHEKWKRIVQEGYYQGKYWEMINTGASFTVTFHEVFPEYYDAKVSGIAHGAPLPSGKGFILQHDISQEIRQDKHALTQLIHQLSESSDFLNNVIDSSPNAVITANKEGFITFANKTVKSVFGHSKSDLLWSHISWLFADGSIPEDIHAGLVDNRKIEINCKKNTGEIFPARLQVSPVNKKDQKSRLMLFVITDITNERMMELSLEEKLRFETLLTDLSAAFVNLPVKEIDQQVTFGLKRIAQFLGIERSGLVQVDMTDGVKITHSWAAEGFEAVSTDIQFDQLPWLFGKIKRGEIINMTRVEDLPEKEIADRKTMLEIGTKSYLSIPLIAGGANFGSLALGCVRSERAWSQDLIQRLKLVGETFANALLRKRAEESLANAFSEIRVLKDKLEAERNYLREEIKLEHNFEDIIGQSPQLQNALHKLEQVAPTNATVFILGESGTGKELFARAIHHESQRKDKPIIKVNCAALPESLIESELFGHEKGAYSGAYAKRVGRFELANGATLFLDEMGELPLDLQAKLLRVLQDGEFERLGSSITIKTDVRIIAATNRNIEKEVENNRFRKDLWYRLNVFPITIPPLRERSGDIPMLVNYFINRFNKKFGKNIDEVTANTLEEMQRYAWPGNIRELENVIERAMINIKGNVFRLADKLVVPDLERSLPVKQQKTLFELEREHIMAILKITKWRISGDKGAAKILDLHPNTLRARIKKLDIRRPS